MNTSQQTPFKSPGSIYFTDFNTPKPSISLSKELKHVLNERNLLTNKTRKRVCSLLDTLSPAERNELDKRASMRLKAMEEILTSEQSYLKQLELLMNYFVVPLEEKNIIEETCHTTLFGQIEMIYNLNGELLTELEKNLENVAQAFLKLAPFFKLYSVYAFDYKNALLILQDLTSKNPVFRRFLEETESRPEVQRKLNSLMIVPIQRIPRYRLLLKQVLMYTSPSDPDFKILQDSVKQVESTVSHIDSVIEDQETTQTLLNLQNSLNNRLPNIVKPSRKIIKEGILNKVTRNGSQVKRYCILMSDIFMYCKILKHRQKNTVVENSLQCCCIFPLRKCKVYEVFPGNFKLTCQGDGIIFCTTDFHASQSWVSSLKDTIEMHIQCRKTLRKESSKKGPMRKKDVQKFDIDYVLSPTKRKSEYESVFRCDASSDSENEDTTLSCFSKRPRMSQTTSTSSVVLAHKKVDDAINSNLMSIDEPCTPTPRNHSVFKKPFTPKSSLTNTKKGVIVFGARGSRPLSANVNRENEKCDDTDPSYGFANRFSESKSFVRTNNIDSNISSTFGVDSVVRDHETTDNTLDILYPLRADSTGSNKSSSSWLHKRNIEQKENGDTPLSESEKPLQRKRVKFEDDVDSLDAYTRADTIQCDSIPTRTQPYQFLNARPNSNSQTISLRQRIVDFFSRLF